MKDLGQSHSERKVGHVSLSSDKREYGPARTPRERHSPDDEYGPGKISRERRSPDDGYGPGGTPGERHSPDDVNSDKIIDTNDQLDTINSGSEDFNAGYRQLESTGIKNLIVIEEDGIDSGKDERKEAKRKKEENRQRKEEKHRRYDEWHQGKLERHSSKLRFQSAHAAISH
ncbi:hypothetical protein DsansV1_C01g0000621 [Dioscorea sansibarensis]